MSDWKSEEDFDDDQLNIQIKNSEINLSKFDSATQKNNTYMTLHSDGTFEPEMYKKVNEDFIKEINKKQNEYELAVVAQTAGNAKRIESDSKGNFSSSSNEKKEDDSNQQMLNQLFTDNDFDETIYDIHDIENSQKVKTDEVKVPVDTDERNRLINQLKTALKDEFKITETHYSLDARVSDVLYQLKAKRLVVKISRMKNNQTELEPQLHYTKLIGAVSELYKLNAIEKLDSTLNYYKEQSETKRISELNETETFEKYMLDIGSKAVHSKTGKHIDSDVLNQLLSQEKRRNSRISAERLSNYQLENQIKQLNKKLKETEHFEGGLNLIDFEQLKIENQTFNEKIDERQMTINKLKLKINNLNLLLAHTKEKIDFVQKEKCFNKSELNKVNKEFKKCQLENSRCKKHRDSLNQTNNVLKQKCGLLANRKYIHEYRAAVTDVHKKKDNVVRLGFLKNKIIKETNLVKAMLSRKPKSPIKKKLYIRF